MEIGGIGDIVYRVARILQKIGGVVQLFVRNYLGKRLAVIFIYQARRLLFA